MGDFISGGTPEASAQFLSVHPAQARGFNRYFQALDDPALLQRDPLAESAQRGALEYTQGLLSGLPDLNVASRLDQLYDEFGADRSAVRQKYQAYEKDWRDVFLDPEGRVPSMYREELLPLWQGYLSRAQQDPEVLEYLRPIARGDDLSIDNPQLIAQRQALEAAYARQLPNAMSAIASGSGPASQGALRRASADFAQRGAESTAGLNYNFLLDQYTRQAGAQDMFGRYADQALGRQAQALGGIGGVYDAIANSYATGLRGGQDALTAGERYNLDALRGQGDVMRNLIDYERWPLANIGQMATNYDNARFDPFINYANASNAFNAGAINQFQQPFGLSDALGLASTGIGLVDEFGGLFEDGGVFGPGGPFGGTANPQPVQPTPRPTVTPTVQTAGVTRGIGGGGSGGGSGIGGTLSSGLSGASAGSAFGPWGAAIGGGLGVASSLFSK